MMKGTKIGMVMGMGGLRSEHSASDFYERLANCEPRAFLTFSLDFRL